MKKIVVLVFLGLALFLLACLKPAAFIRGIGGLDGLPSHASRSPLGPKDNDTSGFDTRYSKRKHNTNTKNSHMVHQGHHEKLSQEVIDGIEKFVFFVGNIRSGSSILGFLMDAHPHVVIQSEWEIPSLEKISSKSFKKDLFNSKQGLINPEKDTKKGYDFKVKDLWQGDYSKYIKVIGGKSSGKKIPYLRDTAKFDRNYKILKRGLSIPIRVIQAIRNPFDMIATCAILVDTGGDRRERRKTLVKMKHAFGGPGQQHNNSVKRYDNSKSINHQIGIVFALFTAALEVTEKVIGVENVLQVHNCDLVHNPRETISRVFEFLEVDTTELYLDACEDKVFDSGSRSRNFVVWTPQQIEGIEKRMKRYKALSRYSFDSC